MRLQRVIFVACLYLITCLQGWSQGSSITSSDSCIVLMEILTSKKIDSFNVSVEKKGLRNFIKYIKGCDNSYEYPLAYQDREFVIQIPSYLTRRYYTFGNGMFCINFYDTTSEDQETIRSINIYYDFDSSYKKFVLKEVASGKRKEISDSISGRKIYPFYVSHNSKFAANIFLENNIVVFYYTREKQFEEELRRSILTFRFRDP
jgi:hypothetical protein